MAEIRPFRAWRYNSEKTPSIKDLTFPIEEWGNSQEYLKKDFNAAHLACPNSSQKAGELTRRWKKEKIIIQDPLPAIYSYSISFTDTEKKPGTLTGFICNIQLQEWSENVILRHENVLPGSVDELVSMLEQTKLHITPSHGLYTDSEFQLEPFLKESLTHPIYEVSTPEGVTHKLGIIQDWKAIQYFAKVLSEKSIILADGHHRYTASLEYLQKHGSGNFSEKWHCIFLSNTEKNSFCINPIHRQVKNSKTLSKEALTEKLKDFFSVELIENPYKLEEILSNKGPYSFGFLFQNQYMIGTLKNGLEKTISWNFPEIIKELDLTVLHYFVFEKCLNIKGKDQKNSKNINFSYNFTKVLTNVSDGADIMGIITRPVSMEEVKKVCYSGYTLPHKSTWFLPKVLCGLVFSTIDPEDFTIEHELYKELNQKTLS